MYAFNYHRPSTVEDAATLLAGNGEAKLMAGGQTLLPAMKHRFASPSDIVDLGQLRPALAGIGEEGGRIAIGALPRHG